MILKLNGKLFQRQGAADEKALSPQATCVLSPDRDHSISIQPCRGTSDKDDQMNKDKEKLASDQTSDDDDLELRQRSVNLNPVLQRDKDDKMNEDEEELVPEQTGEDDDLELRQRSVKPNPAY